MPSKHLKLLSIIFARSSGSGVGRDNAKKIQGGGIRSMDINPKSSCIEKRDNIQQVSLRLYHYHLQPKMNCEHRRRPLLLSTYLGLSMLILSHTTASTTNFCGTSWEDASTDCSNKQPCPLGTDEECEIGTCWADTACDTAAGGGLVFDNENPKHSRFCGIGWNEAKDNCSPATHCPSGSKDECEDGEECYSFLPGCHFVDMMTGGEEQNQPTNKPTLPKLEPEDPARSNYCGSSFADAESSCFKDDHWCPSGGDGDCPAGKSCFASTSCKFVTDLEPSRAPIRQPTAEPTPAPLIYDTIENTRFCGVGWDDASNTCRIKSHCPSGLSSDCPVGQNCYGWISGCNIVDLREHLLATGTEVFGKDHLPLPDGGGGFELQTVTRPPAEAPPFSPPLVPIDIENSIPENHVFCGYTFQDASSRCSIETFCSDGVNHNCPPGEHCWSDVTACNAGEWWRAPLTSAMTLSPIRQPSVSPVPPPIFNPTQQPNAFDLIVTTAEPVSKVTDPPTLFSVITSSDNAEIITVSTSPSPLTSSLVTVTSPPVSSSAAVSLSPSHSPSHNSAVMSVSSSPTNKPTKYSLTEDEIANRLTNYNNYCAKSQAEVLEQCSYTLETCNDLMMICPVGTFCFYNIMCPDLTTSSPTRQPSLRPLTNSPTHQLQNYCAENSLELLGKCNTAPTCNEGDDPCPANTMCFKEIICDAIQDKTATPTLKPSGVTSNQTLKPVMLPENPFECTGLCLMPIDSSDRDYVMSVGLNILPCNRLEVQIGDICLATGRCGTNFELNNCPNDQALYIRVESSMCAGLLGGSGVILPATIERQTASPSLSPASIPIEENALSELLSKPIPVPISETPAADSDSNTNTTLKSKGTPKDTDMMSDFIDQDVDNEKTFEEGSENFIDWWRDPTSSCLQKQVMAMLRIGYSIIIFINAL